MWQFQRPYAEDRFRLSLRQRRPGGRIRNRRRVRGVRARKRARRTDGRGYASVPLVRCSGFWVRVRYSFMFRSSQVYVDVHAREPGRKLLDDVLEILSDSRLWSSLSHAQRCPFADVESFGHAQPGVRSYAWALLQTLLEKWPGALPPSVTQDDRLSGGM